MKYTATQAHRSDYPDPIALQQGDLLTIGDAYDGPEGWEGWLFCTTSGHAGGWVPEQIIERHADGSGQALEDYCARELDVDTGETLVGTRTLNGWVWCERLIGTGSGWVPMNKLRSVGT